METLDYRYEKLKNQHNSVLILSNKFCIIFHWKFRNRYFVNYCLILFSKSSDKMFKETSSKKVPGSKKLFHQEF